MKRKLIISIISLLFCINTFAATPQKLSEEDCKHIIVSYKIDPKIKSAKGWKRIFESDKWRKAFQLDHYTEEELECLEAYILANAMDVKSYNRYIGMELKI